jgi:two-component system phosphate regulon response regulator PhoB
MPEGTRVLLVDDDPAMLRLLEVNFRLEGFVVESATRGDEALAIAAASPPAAVLLDMMMPGMDGGEVCRRLRVLPGLDQVPVVFLSARVRDEDEPEDAALGPVTHVAKPFDPQELVGLVRRLIGETAA